MVFNHSFIYISEIKTAKHTYHFINKLTFFFKTDYQITKLN